MNFKAKADYRVLTTLEEPYTDIVSCDVDDRFGVVYLAQSGDCYHVIVNGSVWQTWQKREWPFVHRVKWFEGERALVWIAHEGAILLSRGGGAQPLPYGTLSDIFVSANYAYVTYSEEAIFASSRDDPESNIISIYSKAGEQLFGLVSIIDNVIHSGIVMEVSHACISGDALFFLAYDTPHIWRLDAASRGVSCINPDSDLRNVIAISVLGEMLCLLKISGTGQRYIEVCSLGSMNATKVGEIESLELNTFNPEQAHGMPGGTFLLSKRAAVASLRVVVSD